MSVEEDLFLEDVLEGLFLPNRRIPSKYFYDETGDKIFQEIMKLPEYYLPNAELEILKSQALQLIDGFEHPTFDILELGAGDGSKTIYFLEQLQQNNRNFVYKPLDISSEVLKSNQRLIKSRLPDIEVSPVPGDYFITMSKIKQESPRLFLFMGSNIGNYENGAAVSFLKHIREFMQEGDRLLVGLDLRKNPKTILAAYHDSKGITKKFNLNLLRRMNRELGANFDVKAFDHYPTYDPISGITKSFLVSLKDQKVHIKNYTFSFGKGDVIQTEISQKYNLKQIDQMSRLAGFRKVQHFLDHRRYFSISTFE